MNLPLSLNLLAFWPCCWAGTNPPHRLEPGQESIAGLVLGVVFGLILHTVYGAGHPVLKATIAWLDWSATATSACCR